MELLDGNDQAWDLALGVLDTIGDDEWSRPTPCANWTVRDLTAHLGGIESMFQGFDQPEPPADFVPPDNPLDATTESAVAARREWTTDQVIDEVVRASRAARERFHALDEDGWAQETFGPTGTTTMAGLCTVRTFDTYVHVLDLRHALGRPQTPDDEAAACRVAVGWVTDKIGWGAVKRAGLADGSRVRLALRGPGGLEADLVVDGGRGSLGPAEGDLPADVIEGHAAGLLMTATGRAQVADSVGGVTATGPAASALLERYQLFA